MPKNNHQANNSGRVITRFGAELLVKTSNNQHIRCTARRKFDHIACGDYVEWQANEQGNANITKLLPRKNTLSRPDRRGKPKAIAANIDQLFIISSWLPKPAWHLVDRYLIAAQKLSIDAIVVMNKSDLARQYSTEIEQQTLADYADIGIPVIHAQATKSIGIDEIKQQLDQKTSIFVGQSGVGKSSLIGQILPQTVIKTGTISATGEGRHTTTTADLYEIQENEIHAYVIDSPGVRDFIIPDLQTKDIIAGYREFQEYSLYCRFNNCTHQHEPGCAVKQAVTQKQLPRLRYQRYLEQLEQLAQQTLDHSFRL